MATSPKLSKPPKLPKPLKRPISSKSAKPPAASSPTPTSTLNTSQAVGALLRQRRLALALTQANVASLGHTGQRFVIDLERGKPTVQLQKVLAVLDLLGLELVIQPKPDAMGVS